MKRPVLFVGGPMDGARLQVEESQHRVYANVLPPVAPLGPYFRPSNATERFEKVAYVISKFRGGSGYVGWVGTMETDARDPMQILLESYSKAR